MFNVKLSGIKFLLENFTVSRCSRLDSALYSFLVERIKFIVSFVRFCGTDFYFYCCNELCSGFFSGMLMLFFFSVFFLFFYSFDGNPFRVYGCFFLGNYD